MAKLCQTQTPGPCSHVEESPLGDSSRNGISLHRRVDISGLISWPTIKYYYFFFFKLGKVVGKRGNGAEATWLCEHPECQWAPC